jgi:hypothetical protein
LQEQSLPMRGGGWIVVKATSWRDKMVWWLASTL